MLLVTSLVERATWMRRIHVVATWHHPVLVGSRIRHARRHSSLQLTSHGTTHRSTHRAAHVAVHRVAHLIVHRVTHGSHRVAHAHRITSHLVVHLIVHRAASHLVVHVIHHVVVHHRLLRAWSTSAGATRSLRRGSALRRFLNCISNWTTGRAIGVLAFSVMAQNST